MPTEVKGADKLRKALREFEPDLAKETTKELGNLLKPITAKARGYMPSESPLSGWAERPDGKGKFPTYNPTLAKRGISYKTSPSKANRRGWRSLVSIINKSAAGAIYETAGRKNPGGNFSPRLGGDVKGRDKLQGRAIFRAWEEDQGKTQGAVIKAIEASATKFNNRSPKVM
jgi:hypothetical protein